MKNLLGIATAALVAGWLCLSAGMVAASQPAPPPPPALAVVTPLPEPAPLSAGRTDAETVTCVTKALTETSGFTGSRKHRENQARLMGRSGHLPAMAMIDGVMTPVVGSVWATCSGKPTKLAMSQWRTQYWFAHANYRDSPQSITEYRSVATFIGDDSLQHLYRDVAYCGETNGKKVHCKNAVASLERQLQEAKHGAQFWLPLITFTGIGILIGLFISFLMSRPRRAISSMGGIEQIGPAGQHTPPPTN
jgi:hypothetical protein